MSTYQSVAAYSVPYKIFIFLFVIPVVLKKVLFPRLSNLYLHSLEEYKETFCNACRIIALLALPISVGLFLLSDKIVVFLFTKDYTSSIVPFQIMAVSLVFVFLRNVFNVTLYSSNLEYTAIVIFGLAVLLNGILDYILIPKIDVVGAALATLCAEIFICLCYFYYLRNKQFTAKYLKTGIRIGISSFIMGIALVMSRPCHLFAQMFIAGFTYVILIHYFRIFKKEEYAAFKEFLIKGLEKGKFKTINK